MSESTKATSTAGFFLWISTYSDAPSEAICALPEESDSMVTLKSVVVMISQGTPAPSAMASPNTSRMFSYSVVEFEGSHAKMIFSGFATSFAPSAKPSVDGSAEPPDEQPASPKTAAAPTAAAPPTTNWRRSRFFSIFNTRFHTKRSPNAHEAHCYWIASIQ